MRAPMMAPAMAPGTQAASRAGSSTAFLGWSALAVVGQAALLGATTAGPFVTYQHVRWPAEPTPAWWACAGILAFHCACVATALLRERARTLREWSAWLSRNLRPWQAMLLLALLAATRAKIARPPEAYAGEVLFSACTALLFLATWALAARAFPETGIPRLASRLQSFLGAGGEGPAPGGPDRFAWTLAAFATVATALLAWFVYERHPHVPDEVAYLIHAETFAAGKLALAVPPVPAGFDVDLMLALDGRWFSPTPPGWPILLAVGAWLGAAWLVNPVLSGATLLVAYALVRELAGLGVARLATLLLAISPWFLFLGMSFMTHTWVDFCALLAALGVARARRTKPIAWTLVAGAAIGIVSWIRPLEGLVVALLLGLWSIGLGGSRLPLRAVASLVLSTAAVAALILPYNQALTGKASHHPIMEYVDRVYGTGKNDLGFGADRGLDWGGLDPWPGHTPFQALVNAQFNGFALDTELFGWASGAVLWIALGCLWSPRRRLVRACSAVILATVVANGLYWFSGGPDFGARYWYLVILPCTLLTVLGLEALATRLGKDAPRVSIALALACTAAMLTFIPWRACDKYRDYRGMQPGIRELDASRPFGRSLVLVRGERHPDYASVAVYNPLDWEASAPVYAWDRGPSVREELLRHYADRPVWLVDGPSRTGRGFEVRAGPLSASEVPAWEAR